MDSRLLFGLVVATGVVVPGVSNYLLSNAGYDTLGSVVWVLGYAVMVFVVWYRWIRPIDFGGSRGGTEP